MSLTISSLARGLRDMVERGCSSEGLTAFEVELAEQRSANVEDVLDSSAEGRETRQYILE